MLSKLKGMCYLWGKRRREMLSNPSCQEIREQMPLYVRGELALSAQETWAEHLAACSFCQGEEKGERRLQAVSRLPPKPALPEPPGLAERIRKEVPRQLKKRHQCRQVKRSAALACAALFLGGVLWLGWYPPVDWDSYQRLAHRAQREFFWANTPEPVASYEQLETAQTFPDTLLDYGLSRSQRSRYQEAVHRLEGRLRRQPRNAQGWMLLGTFSLGLDQPQAGRQAFQRALDLDPALAEVHRLRSEAYRRERRFEKALEAANRAIARAPREALPYCQRAAVQSGQRDYEAALEDLAQAEARDPNAPEVYLGRGSVYLEIGRYLEAAAAFQKALALDPSYHHARVLLGAVYYFQSKSAQAVSEAQQVLRENPDYPLAYLLLGTVYEDNGQHEAAIAAYQRALEANPYQDYTAYRLGRQYAILDHPQAAQATFTALVEEAPDAYMLHLQLGLVYQQLGQPREAVQELQIALQQHPQIAYTHVSLASAFHAAGQPERALETLLEAARRFPQESQVFEVLYGFLRETPDVTGPAYPKAQAELARQRGPRTQHFLATVEKLAREKGVLRQVQPLLNQGDQFLKAGDVIQAEQRGLALCEQYHLGVSVTLGPQNQESGLQQVDLPGRDGGTEAVADLGGRTARRTRADHKQKWIYFDVPEDLRPAHGAWALVEYWDAPDNRFLIEYDSTDTDFWFRGAYKWTENVWKGNTETWQSYVFYLPDAAFRGRQHEGTDFRIFSRGWRDTAVHSVRVLIVPGEGEREE